MNSKKLFILLMLSLFAFSVFAGKKSITFNAMITNAKMKKEVEKKLKKQAGVYSVKADEKMGTVAIEYDDAKTDINTLTSAFKAVGVYATPVGESCANKPGGCLNNKPTTTNTMR